jgi:UDP-N-acetylmuramoyl-tripeptide--D-alanyl-D-alanine ligase
VTAARAAAEALAQAREKKLNSLQIKFVSLVHFDATGQTDREFQPALRFEINNVRVEPFDGGQVRNMHAQRRLMRLMAADVAKATNGTLVGQNAHLSGVSFDSRSVRPGQLFVPIVAERDGHEFIESALSAGAGAYFTTGKTFGRTSIMVPDTLAALLQLGAWGRNKLDTQLANRVVGITGSVGKTSTKDFVAAAIGSALRVTANERSFNNDQGLPVTILNAPDDVEALVLEMGMRGFGEIARLCTVARPNIGVVTKVASAHTERVGDIDGVARAKSELVMALVASGCAVLNADDDRVVAMQSLTSAQVITYGVTQTADVRMTSCILD